MRFDQLSDDMKLAILNKINFNGINAFRSCSRNSNSLVLQLAKHLQCTKMIENVLYHEYYLESKEWTPQGISIDRTFWMNQGFHEAVRWLRNRTIETMEIALIINLNGSIDRLHRFIRESNLSARSLIVSLGVQVNLSVLLAMLRPETLSLHMRMENIKMSEWNRLIFPKELVKLTITNNNRGARIATCKLRIPRGIRRLSVKGVNICEESLNKIFKRWLRRIKIIKSYTIADFDGSIGVLKLFLGINYNMQPPYIFENSHSARRADYDGGGDTSSEKIYVIPRTDGKKLKVMISRRKLEVTGPGFHH